MSGASASDGLTVAHSGRLSRRAVSWRVSELGLDRRRSGGRWRGPPRARGRGRRPTRAPRGGRRARRRRSRAGAAGRPAGGRRPAPGPRPSPARPGRGRHRPRWMAAATAGSTVVGSARSSSVRPYGAQAWASAVAGGGDGRLGALGEVGAELLDLVGRAAEVAQRGVVRRAPRPRGPWPGARRRPGRPAPPRPRVALRCSVEAASTVPRTLGRPWRRRAGGGSRGSSARRPARAPLARRRRPWRSRLPGQHERRRADRRRRSSRPNGMSSGVLIVPASAMATPRPAPATPGRRTASAACSAASRSAWAASISSITAGGGPPSSPPRPPSDTWTRCTSSPAAMSRSAVRHSAS